MGILVSVLLAVAPPVLFLIWILRFDRIEPEPLGFVFRMLFLGCLSVIPAALIEVPVLELGFFQGTGLLPAALQSFLVISPVEELVKLATVLLFVWRSKNFNEANDGIVYAGTVSIGFALAENLMYVMEHGIAVGVARALTSIPGHTFSGVLMGYFLGRAKFGMGSKGKNLLLAFVIPWALHGTYDTFALSGTTVSLLVIPMVVLYFIVGIRYLKKGRALSKARWGSGAVDAVIVTPQEKQDQREKGAGCRRVIGRILLVLSGLFWILILAGLTLGQDSLETDPMNIIAGSMIITAVPIATGIALEVSSRKKPS